MVCTFIMQPYNEPQLYQIRYQQPSIFSKNLTPYDIYKNKELLREKNMIFIKIER